MFFEIFFWVSLNGVQLIPGRVWGWNHNWRVTAPSEFHLWAAQLFHRTWLQSIYLEMWNEMYSILTELFQHIKCWLWVKYVVVAIFYLSVREQIEQNTYDTKAIYLLGCLTRRMWNSNKRCSFKNKAVSEPSQKIISDKMYSKWLHLRLIKSD